MRIIAGQFRGRRLKTLEGAAIRPTSDKLRETLFNILAPWIEGAIFLDVYAGTGAVGLEALSRGAGRVVLIESNAAAQKLIEQNLSWLPSGQPIELRRDTAARGVRSLAAAGIATDICFLDPPYAALAEAVSLLDQIVDARMTKQEGWIILEHARRDAAPEAIGPAPQSWKRMRLLLQGDSALSFYRKEN